ncbi:MAG TPA: hypothetical protein VI454_03055 [Verrucomicrobiae bacterium]|jgi:DNA-directed RNA polymerase specialized sigma24 family protein
MKSIGFEELRTQMVITNRLLAAQLRNTMKQAELIELLSTTGASAQEIAGVLNTTANAVAVALHKQRKRQKAS